MTSLTVRIAGSISSSSLGLVGLCDHLVVSITDRASGPDRENDLGLFGPLVALRPDFAPWFGVQNQRQLVTLG